MPTLTRKSSDAAEAPNPMSAQVVVLPHKVADETALIAGLCRRDAVAAQSLYMQYAGLVRRVLIQVLGSDRDVDDLVQDTLIVVVNRAPALRKVQSFRSFVIGVAIHLAKNEIRRRAIRRFVGLEEVTELPLVDPHDAAAAEVARHLYRALDSLEISARMAFVLRHVHGCELAEVAAACSCSVATVKRRLARAEKRLTKLIEVDPVLREAMGNTFMRIPGVS
ncbi:MAG TPA: RNA polymerase sigma factor [Polyangiaceae bacterium]